MVVNAPGTRGATLSICVSLSSFVIDLMPFPGEKEEGSKRKEEGLGTLLGEEDGSYE